MFSTYLYCKLNPPVRPFQQSGQLLGQGECDPNALDNQVSQSISGKHLLDNQIS